MATCRSDRNKVDDGFFGRKHAKRIIVQNKRIRSLPEFYTSPVCPGELQNKYIDYISDKKIRDTFGRHGSQKLN